MDITTIAALDGNRRPQQMLAASDADGNLAAAQVLVDRTGNPLGRLGLYSDIAGSMVRPATSDAYSAGAIVSDNVAAISLPNFSPTPGGGAALIKAARLIVHQTGLSGVTFRAMLFTAAPSAIADGSQFSMLWADRSKRVGWIDFTTPVDMGGVNADCTEYVGELTGGAELPIAVPSVTSLLAVLVVQSSWTPNPSIGIDLRVTVTNQSGAPAFVPPPPPPEPADVLAAILASPRMNVVPFRRTNFLTWDDSTCQLERLPLPAAQAISGPDDRVVIGSDKINGYTQLPASAWMAGPIIIALGGVQNVTTVGIANLAYNRTYRIRLNSATVRFDPGPLGTIEGFGNNGQMLEVDGFDSFDLERLSLLGFWIGAAANFSDFGRNDTPPIWDWNKNPNGKYTAIAELAVNASGAGGIDLPGIFIGSTYQTSVCALGNNNGAGDVHVLTETAGTPAVGMTPAVNPHITVRNNYAFNVIVRFTVQNLTQT